MGWKNQAPSPTSAFLYTDLISFLYPDVSHVFDDKHSSSSSYDDVPALWAVVCVESPGSAGRWFWPGEEAWPGQATGGDLTSEPSNTVGVGVDIGIDVGIGVGATAAAAATEWFMKATSRRSSSSALACNDAWKPLEYYGRVYYNK